MGLFKSLTDPGGGGDKGGVGPDGEEKVFDPTGHDPLSKVQDPREQARAQMAARRIETDGRQIDTAALVMGGVAADAQIDSVKKASKQINLQDTFVVELTVFPEDGDPYAISVTQPVAEQYVDSVVAGSPARVKYMATDLSQVWIDWASTSNL